MPSKRFLSDFVRWCVRDKDLAIISGIGLGLRFNAAATDPRTILGTNGSQIQKVLSSSLTEGDVFYDIGANIGFFSVIGAKLVGSTGRVYAFEPAPDNYSCISHNLDLNSLLNTEVITKAITNITGHGQFSLAENSAEGSLTRSGVVKNGRKEIQVELDTIDNMGAKQHLDPPTLIKIDVKGTELEILQGMSETVDAYHPTIIYELEAETDKALSQRQATCDGFLRHHGYKLKRLDRPYPDNGWKVSHTLAKPK